LELRNATSFDHLLLLLAFLPENTKAGSKSLKKRTGEAATSGPNAFAPDPEAQPRLAFYAVSSAHTASCGLLHGAHGTGDDRDGLMRYGANGENERFERDEAGGQLIGGTVRSQTGFCIHVADGELLGLLEDVAALARLRDVPLGQLHQSARLCVRVVQLPTPNTVSRGGICGGFPGAHSEIRCLSG